MLCKRDQITLEEREKQGTNNSKTKLVAYLVWEWTISLASVKGNGNEQEHKMFWYLNIYCYSFIDCVYSNRKYIIMDRWRF